MQVSEAEWLVFILQELQLVDKHELDNILEMFKAVDTNGDGVLDMADVRRRSRTHDRMDPGPSASPLSNGAMSSPRDSSNV